MFWIQGFGMWRAGYQFVATTLPKCQYGFLQGLWGQGGGLFSFLLSVSVLVKIISYIYLFFFWSLYNAGTSLCIVTWMLSEWMFDGIFCSLLLCVTSLEVSSNGTQCKQSRLELEVNTLDCLPVEKSLSAKQQTHLDMFFISFLGLQSSGRATQCSSAALRSLKISFSWYSFCFFLSKVFQ